MNSQEITTATVETPQASAVTSPSSATAAPDKTENMGVAQLSAMFAAARKPTETAPAAQPEGDEQPNPADQDEAPAPGDQVEEGTDVREETEEEPEESGDPEATVEAEETEVQPGDPKGVVKRIGKLTAKLKAKDAEIAAKDAEIARLKGGKAETPAPAIAPDLSEAPELAAIDRDITTHRQILAWCRANPEGGEAVIGGQSYGSVDPDRVDEIVRRSESSLTSLTARREARAEIISERVQVERAEWGQKANTDFPWLKSQSGPEWNKALEVLGGFTKQAKQALLANTQGLYLLGATVEGLLAKSQRAATPAKPRTAPPKVPAKPAGAAAQRSSPKATLEKSLQQAEAAYESSGRGEDFARVQTLKRQLRAV